MPTTGLLSQNLPTLHPDAHKPTQSSPLTIDSLGHIRPRIYLTREVDELSETYAPGIENHRANLSKYLNERTTQSLSARSLESLLRSSKNGNRVLVVKSQTSLPYTSIYIELESGYWDGESETALRKNEL